MEAVGHGSDAYLWPLRGRHPILGGTIAMEPVEFGAEIARDQDEVFVVARCEEVVEQAEAAEQPEIAFMIDGIRRFLLGRLTGSPGGLED